MLGLRNSVEARQGAIHYNTGVCGKALFWGSPAIHRILSIQQRAGILPPKGAGRYVPPAFLKMKFAPMAIKSRIVASGLMPFLLVFAQQPI